MEQPTAIAARWIHSFEEDDGDRMVFRPPSYGFPRSRGARFGLDLTADGIAKIDGPGPADRPTLKEGRWSIVPGEGLGTLRLLSAEGLTYEWSIVAAEPERLVLKKGAGVDR